MRKRSPDQTSERSQRIADADQRFVCASCIDGRVLHDLRIVEGSGVQEPRGRAEQNLTQDDQRDARAEQGQCEADR